MSRSTNSGNARFPFSLSQLAKILGGNVSGDGVLAPGPNHSPKDRSLSVTLSADAPDGFVVFSHAGDDSLACKDCDRDGSRRFPVAFTDTLVSRWLLAPSCAPQRTAS
jgi:hypothetical protein